MAKIDRVSLFLPSVCVFSSWQRVLFGFWVWLGSPPGHSTGFSDYFIACVRQGSYVEWLRLVHWISLSLRRLVLWGLVWFWRRSFLLLFLQVRWGKVDLSCWPSGSWGLFWRASRWICFFTAPICSFPSLDWWFLSWVFSCSLSLWFALWSWCWFLFWSISSLRLEAPPSGVFGVSFWLCWCG